MNNKKLSYVLIGLIFLFIISQLYNRKSDRSFNEELIKLDTAAISRIVLHPKAEAPHAIELTKANGQWQATKEGLKVPAVNESVLAILRELTLIKIKSILTTNKEKWKEYEIEDSTGSRVEVYKENKKIADFFVGKFGFNPQTNSMTSYIRIKNDAAVNGIDGFQSMTFNPSFDGFRDKTIANVDIQQIQYIEFKNLTDQYSLAKMDNQWKLNNSQLIDSAAMAAYLNGLQNLQGLNLKDNYKPGNSVQKLIIKSSTSPDLDIEWYSSGDSTKPFIFHSSANPTVHFQGDSSGVFAQVFQALNTLLPKAKSVTKAKK